MKVTDPKAFPLLSSPRSVSEKQEHAPTRSPFRHYSDGLLVLTAVCAVVTRTRFIRLAAITVCLAVAAAATAQFGHPLKGSWSGEWGPTKDNRTHVLMEIRWDGRQLTSVLNPGPNSIVMKTTTLDPASWMVHVEGEGKNATGAAVRYVIDGKLENIGAYARFMTGTWTQGTQKGDFKLTMN